MKQLEILISIKVIFTFICLIIFNSETLNAQDFGVTNRVTEQKKIQGGRRNIPRPRQPVKVIYEEKLKYIPTKPTGLSVAALPNADIALESIDLRKKVERSGKIKDGSITFEIRDGKYKLSASLDGYDSQVAEIIVEREKLKVINIDLKQVTHNFSIKTNVSEGEVRFAPVTVLEGENTDDTVKVKERGGFCVTPIIAGKATIKEMPEGDYILNVRAGEVGYQAETVVINVPEDIPEAKEADPKADVSFGIELENTQSVNTFTSLGEGNWALPANWKMDGVIIKAGGAGIALPKDKTFRFYKDFEMQSKVRLPDNASAGFVVRAKDENNYYLIQFTGKTTKDPFMVSGIIVKDGKPTEQVMWTTTRHVIEKAVSEQKDFEVHIKAEGNRFKIFAVDETGKLQPLGDAIFKDNNYPIGAVGISTLENSGFEVSRFVICNEVCR